jgi:hypothetical protein
MRVIVSSTTGEGSGVGAGSGAVPAAAAGTTAAALALASTMGGALSKTTGVISGRGGSATAAASSAGRWAR